jgi:hypothetical protein
MSLVMGDKKEVSSSRKCCSCLACGSSVILEILLDWL